MIPLDSHQIKYKSDDNGMMVKVIEGQKKPCKPKILLSEKIYLKNKIKNISEK